MPRYSKWGAIGQGFGDALNILAGAYLQKTQRDQQQGLLNQLMNQTDTVQVPNPTYNPNPGSTELSPPPGLNMGQMSVPMASGPETVPQTQGRDIYDPRNMGLLSQLNPQVLNMLGMIDQSRPKFQTHFDQTTGLNQWATDRRGGVVPGSYQNLGGGVQKKTPEPNSEFDLRLALSNPNLDPATRDQYSAALKNIESAKQNIPSLQGKGMTERGFTLSFDPTSGATYAVNNATRKREPYNLATHGKIVDEGQYTQARRLALSLSLPDKFNNDKQVALELKKMDAATMVRDIVTSNTPIEAASIPTFMARLSGEVGNLSEADKRPFGGTRAIQGRLEQFQNELTRGTLTEENKKYVLDIVDTIERAAGKNLKRRAGILSKQYAISAQDIMSPEEIANIFTAGIPAPIEMQDGRNNVGSGNDFDNWTTEELEEYGRTGKRPTGR